MSKHIIDIEGKPNRQIAKFGFPPCIPSKPPLKNFLVVVGRQVFFQLLARPSTFPNEQSCYLLSLLNLVIGFVILHDRPSRTLARGMVNTQFLSQFMLLKKCTEDFSLMYVLPFGTYYGKCELIKNYLYTYILSTNTFSFLIMNVLMFFTTFCV